MELSWRSKYFFQQTWLMLFFTYAKIMILYLYIYIPLHPVGVYIRTFSLLMLIYLLLHYLLLQTSFAMRLFIHELFAFIIVADLLYYMYFQALPGAKELTLLHIIPSVWDSIQYLFNPLYMLFFADGILLWLHDRLVRGKRKIEAINIKPALLGILLLLGSIMIDASHNNNTSSNQTYHSFGLVHYHIRELTSGLTNQKNMQPKSIAIKNAIRKPKGKEAKYYGIGKGRNVIVIQVEALQNFVINRYYNGQELTPNLNKLVKDSIYFNRFYQQIGAGGTSDAEFTMQHSLYPSMKGSVYKLYADYDFYGLPKILKEKGYTTKAFHGYKPEFWNRAQIYPVLGFDQFISAKNFKPEASVGWGLSDKSFFKQSADYLKETQQPFYAFLITLSSHYPYTVKDINKNIQLEPKDEGTLIGHYLQIINYTDAALGYFIEQLKNSGLYDNAVLAVYGDHTAISCTDNLLRSRMESILGHRYNFDEMLNVPLIINMPGSNVKGVKSIVGSNIDFLPTLLNIMGIQENKAYFFGQDLCNASSGFVAFQTNMIKGSFIDDKNVFKMSRDEVFENSAAWRLDTKKPVDIALCREGYSRALNEIAQSEYLVSNNLMKQFFTDLKTPPAEQAQKENVREKSNPNFLKQLTMLLRTVSN